MKNLVRIAILADSQAQVETFLHQNLDTALRLLEQTEGSVVWLGAAIIYSAETQDRWEADLPKGTPCVSITIEGPKIGWKNAGFLAKANKFRRVIEHYGEPVSFEEAVRRAILIYEVDNALAEMATLKPAPKPISELIDVDILDRIIEFESGGRLRGLPEFDFSLDHSAALTGEAALDEGIEEGATVVDIEARNAHVAERDRTAMQRAKQKGLIKIIKAGVAHAERRRIADGLRAMSDKALTEGGDAITGYLAAQLETLADMVQDGEVTAIGRGARRAAR